jgi:hypothetical protein
MIRFEEEPHDMSHVATIALEFRDPAALAEAAAACGLGLVQDTVIFYDGTRVTGTAIRLPGWRYPVVVDGAGRLHYDHYEGRWGDVAELHRFRQAYAEAATARFARAGGYVITRATQADGTVRLALSR